MTGQPVYESLSYAWGSEDEPVAVHVKSKSRRQGVIYVTQNLKVALQHLRFTHRARLLWTDALCIDQQNDEEKSSQVAIMGRIYSLAECVIAFLGPEADKSNDALRLMGDIASHLHMNWKTNTLTPSDGSQESLEWADLSVALPYQSGELDPVCALLDRQYFQRTWIRQEVTLATKVFAQCGYQQLSWNDLRVSIACLYLKDRYNGAISPDRSTTLRRVLHSGFLLCYLARGDFLYCSLKMTLRDAKCKDPRDRVYSVLSLLGYNDQNLGVTPDYTKPVEELYVEVGRKVVLQQRQLSLFETCELSAKKLDGIPTWVPDWSSRLGHRVLPDATNWSACGWISAQATITNDNVMHATGVQVSPIDQVVELTIGEYEWDDSQVVDLLRQLQPPREAMDDLEWDKIVEKYCRALVCDGFSENYIPSHQSYPDFKQSKRYLESIWSEEANGTSGDLYLDDLGLSYVTYCQNCFIGRSFFSTADGYIGLAPKGTRKGDVICVLLGCRFPVVLRPVSTTSSDQTWQLVGISHVQGLMNGEAIYGNKLSSKYRSVSRKDQLDELIDGWGIILYDFETGEYKNDPETILTDIGIKVEKYERNPHFLEVLPVSLREAGINAETFALT